MDKDSGFIDIGHNHEIKYVSYGHDMRTAIKYTHNKPDGTPCEGFIAFAGGAWANEFDNIATWDVISKDPLTLSPSLLCRICGDHGFIRDSKWVVA